MLGMAAVGRLPSICRPWFNVRFRGTAARHGQRQHTASDPPSQMAASGCSMLEAVKISALAAGNPGYAPYYFLAYKLVHQLRLTLETQGINDSWQTIPTTLGTQMRTTASMHGEHGEQIHIRKEQLPPCVTASTAAGLGTAVESGQDTEDRCHTVNRRK